MWTRETGRVFYRCFPRFTSRRHTSSLPLLTVLGVARSRSKFHLSYQKVVGCCRFTTVSASRRTSSSFEELDDGVSSYKKFKVDNTMLSEMEGDIAKFKKEDVLSPDCSNCRLMLIDGTSVLYRSYYKLLARLHHGMLEHADGNGDWVLTIFTALSFLLEILEFTPSHVVVVFDHDGEIAMPICPYN
ncbi:hypothetical protein ZOSMA_12G00180 [Zostera marina]|uniref:Uncharacterized protein n=1 Tax=Zostera marina TaxID=29655 RepID=A0A0K9PZH9_ZOSMR|nr:hypothetical protein ZOSMA_12G00180 [Zostera marina]